MDERVKNFINENLDLINQNTKESWEEIYKKRFPQGFTEILLKSGINPLEQELNYIPEYFLTHASIDQFVIPNSVTSIGSYAFRDCSSLTSVTIGDSVINIGKYAFEDCDSLTKVNYTGTIDKWVQIEFSGYYANPLQYAKNLYINGELVTQANITTATKINSYAFRNCKSLTSVVIGNSVKSISDAAFSGCYLLSNIVYKGSIKEFEAVKKSREGDYGAPAVEVICTDGVIKL